MLSVVFPSFDNSRKSPAQICSKLELMPSLQRADMCHISREAYCGTLSMPRNSGNIYTLPPELKSGGDQRLQLGGHNLDGQAQLL